MKIVLLKINVFNLDIRKRKETKENNLYSLRAKKMKIIWLILQGI